MGEGYAGCCNVRGGLLSVVRLKKFLVFLEFRALRPLGSKRWGNYPPCQRSQRLTTLAAASGADRVERVIQRWRLPVVLDGDLLELLTVDNVSSVMNFYNSLTSSELL